MAGLDGSKKKRMAGLWGVVRETCYTLWNDTSYTLLTIVQDCKGMKYSAIPMYFYLL